MAWSEGATSASQRSSLQCVNVHGWAMRDKQACALQQHQTRPAAATAAANGEVRALPQKPEQDGSLQAHKGRVERRKASPPDTAPE